MSPLLEHFGGSPMRIREYECWEFKIKEMVSVATAEAETDQVLVFCQNGHGQTWSQRVIDHLLTFDCTLDVNRIQ